MVSPNNASTPKAAAPPPSRMAMSKVIRGRQTTPERLVLYGVHGIGKSSFGAEMPKPIFLAAEDGTKHLNIDRLPMPETWEDVLDGVRLLTDEKHDYQTLVVDTVDWVEPLLWAYLCRKHSKADIEAFGFGKGYQIAVDSWRLFVAALERMRRAKPMHVLLLAHSWVKPFKNPEGDDYDRHEMKLHKLAAGVVKEWADHVLFANHLTVAKTDQRTKRVRGVSMGERIIYTEHSAAFDAKHRGVLPAQLPLSWPDFYEALQAQQSADPVALTEEILRKAKEIGGDIEAMTAGVLEKANGDTSALAKLNNRLNVKLAEKLAAATPVQPDPQTAA
jgi:hypothetical protein